MIPDPPQSGFNLVPLGFPASLRGKCHRLLLQGVDSGQSPDAILIKRYRSDCIGCQSFLAIQFFKAAAQELLRFTRVERHEVTGTAAQGSRRI